MKKVFEKFESSMASLGLRDYTDYADRIIVAFSGGADSCLLLHLTNAFFSPLGKKIECAHLNHMIRGDEAERDQNFCEQTAERLGIKLHLKCVDIPALVTDGGSVEEVARKERYRFFEELLAESDKTVIMTAHNADDNLETVLFNLIRGASLKGLCGIPPVRDRVYLRPLLEFSASEIRQICKELSIDYVIDSTNLHSDYARNYLRNEVIPSLRSLFPTPELSVFRSSCALRLDAEYLDLEADRFMNMYCKSGIPNSVAISLHDSVLSRVIIRSYDDFTGEGYSVPHLEKKHVDTVMSHLREAPEKTFSLSLPGGISFLSENGIGRFSASVRDATEVDSEATELQLDSPVVKNGYTVIMTRDISRILSEKNENIYNLSIYKSFKFDTIKGKLKIRVRSEGDIYRYGGMTHKVKKIFSEKKLTLEERKRIPVICDEEGILWIPGFPTRDGSSSGEGESFFILCLKNSDNK